MYKWTLKLLLITTLLLTGIFTGFSGIAEAGIEALLTAKQIKEMVVISGKTASEDPDKVPLLIVDSSGQAIYFQDVAGGGSSFAIQFEPPNSAAKGKATATLYSQLPVQSTFVLKKVNEEEVLEVSFRIVGYQEEEILPQVTMKIGEGASVLRLLQKAASEHDFTYELEDADEDGQDVYVKEIDGLGEFDKGPGSGWVYRVNGKVPQAPVDRYIVEEDDQVELLYTSDFGESEGGTGSNLNISYSRLESVSVDKALGRLQYAADAESILEIVHDLLFDLAGYEPEKQRTFLPDVALFLQAACERAALVDADGQEDSNSAQIELSSMKARDLLEEQEKVFTGLHEQLEDSVLYKPLLTKLQPAVVIHLPEKSDKVEWNLLIEEDAWKRILTAKAKVGVVRGDWRSDILPVQQEYTKGNPLRFQFRFYSDSEQTTQWKELEAKGNGAFVPLTSSYRIISSQPEEAKLLLTLPLTGTLEEGSWPVLYVRKDVKAAWDSTTDYVRTTSKTLFVPFHSSGDLIVVGAAPPFFDVQEASPAYSWIKEPIAALAGIGVIKGSSPTQFGLNQSVTRAEFVTLLERLNGKKADVLLPSLPNGRQPSSEEPIRRAEMAFLLDHSSQDLATVEKVSPITWKDTAVFPEWARSAVSGVTAKGWLRGRTDGRFDPMASMTRAEAAAVLYRYWEDKHYRE